MSVSNKKQVIRKFMQEVLAGLSDEEKNTQSRTICTLLHETILGKKVNQIAVFFPYASEPNITPFAEQMMITGATISLPVMRGGFASLLSIEEMYAPHTWYTEVSGEETVDYRTIDMMIVPGIAFTRDGKRLGRGAGWYDRVIALYREQNSGALVIGVCFAEQLVDDLPTSSHDQCVDRVVYA